ncbi:MAG: DUF115 domain-containing protein [Nitrososphaerota archaeon]|nr:DUF115 domain-containing protein [Nitrososphaerota archaeon]
MTGLPSSSLGSLWHGKFYHRIRDSLGLDEEQDRRATNILSKLISVKTGINPNLLSQAINGRSVIVFGAGPSLEDDIVGLRSVLVSGKLAVIAADGAADALEMRSVKPSVVVSDLDSCSVERLIEASTDRILVVHAHGDNIDLMNETIPQLNGNLLGSTQTESSENVINYGGFTDGDRACYIAANFAPRSIALAGMDFGRQEGAFSKSRRQRVIDDNKRRTKLELGKSSLEFLIQIKKEIRFRNLTRYGQEITGAPKVSYSEFISEVFSHDRQ